MLTLYLPMFVIFLVSAGIASAMFGLGHWVGRKNPTAEKMMPYECGNDTEGSRGVRPSVKFYLTAILFVVFDIEVVFMYPWAVRFHSLGWTGLLTMGSFLVALLVALVYCWRKGALQWDA
jgi:NADH-quinone oxidoreductase subunit A